MDSNRNKEESFLKKLSTAIGYVVVSIVVLIFAALGIALAAFLFLGAIALILAGILVIAAGIVFIGIGLSKIFVIPRGAVTSIGFGLLLSGAGLMYETFVAWFIRYAVPFIAGKIKEFADEKFPNLFGKKGESLNEENS
ncbi:MAG: hypothetical protein MJ119_03015 [Lachnospiraceae bacterium]|nr:hypothetical protein [Lachnospiraceae bacterium]